MSPAMMKNNTKQTRLTPKEIHRGLKTHTHPHVMVCVSLRTTKTIVRTPTTLMPPLFEFELSDIFFFLSVPLRRLGVHSTPSELREALFASHVAAEWIRVTTNANAADALGSKAIALALLVVAFLRPHFVLGFLGSLSTSLQFLALVFGSGFALLAHVLGFLLGLSRG